jgi:phosphoglycolate phosphatase
MSPQTPVWPGRYLNLSEALVLFDIDGTLVRRAGPHHRQALVDAVRRITGVETTTDGIPVHGMLDPDILAQMMAAGGLKDRAIREAMPAIIEAAQDIYLNSVPDLRDKHCPGVEPLLERLQSQGIVLALVTGNLTRIGWRKLERAGLDHYFRFGAFGEMAPTRGGLARLAIERARSEGLIGDDTPISLIGDAPQDIMAARENGIRSIAVRTGITPPGDLEACGPDLLLADLTELDLGSIRTHHLK